MSQAKVVNANDAIVFFCHGSRDPQWRLPFDQIATQFKRDFPDRQVEVAFLELMEPSFGAVINSLAEQGITKIRVLPLFLAAGAHTRRDLPQLIADAHQRWPQLHITASPALADAQPIRDAIVTWAASNVPAA